jgi:acetyl-CoA acetyltransferase
MTKSKVAVVGVGYSRIERRSSRTLIQHAVEAAKNAITDAGITAKEIDGVSTYPNVTVFGSPQREGIDVVTSGLLARTLGLGNQVRWHADADQLVPMALIAAINAVAAGMCRYALVFRALNNPDQGAGSYNAYTHDHAINKYQWTAPFGVHRGYQYYGCSYRRYMDLYGAKPEHMATLITNNRRNAMLNDNAHFRNQPLTTDDYLNSRMLTDAVRLLDCDIPVDGAAAMILTSADRAPDHAHPAYVAGYGMYPWPPRTLGPAYDELHECGRVCGDATWSSSGLRPKDISVVQIYDGYSFFVYWWLETFGFCPRGEAFRFIQDGRIAMDGELPVNTFGGQLAEGRLHGIGHFVEAARQAMGTAGPRQIKDVTASLAIVGPVGLGSGAVIFTRTPLS